MQSTTYQDLKSEQPRRLGEITFDLHDVIEAEVQARVERALAERAAEVQGTITVRADGSRMWVAPLSEWLKMRPVPIGGGVS